MYEYGPIVETQFRQRAYDGKWEMLGKIIDYGNKYSYQTSSGSNIALIPEKWITVAVYDYIMEIVE
jgi:hypothetical protein